MDINSINSTAYQGLQMAQAGMLVTSQNVSGSSVDGFSKRNANFIIDSMSPNAKNSTGTAFAVDGFVRQYSALINSQVMNQQAQTGYTDTLVNYTTAINSLVADPTAGLSTSIANFFSAIGTYATNPTSPSSQAAITGAANQVSAGMARMVTMVSQLGSNSKAGLQSTVDQVNTFLPQLASINQQIIQANAGGKNTGVSADMLDQRDLILGKIQSLVGGQSLINNDGTATQLIGGLPLVERSTANKLLVTNLDNPVLKVQFAPAALNGGGGIQEVNGTISGQAGALMDLVKQFVPLVNQRLNTMAQGLVSLANNASGASTASGGALKIFGFVTAAGTFGDTRATGGDITNQIPVTNTDAAMANLYTQNGTDGLGLVALGLTAANFVSLAPSKTSLYVNAGTSAPFITAAAANTVQQLSTLMGNSVASLVSDVGNQVATWSSNQRANEAILVNLNNQKSSVSGVNLDEEAANLLKFQQLYQASSKVLQVGNDMFRSILDIMN